MPAAATRKTAQGPYVAGEQSAPTAVRPAEGPAPDVTVRRRRSEVGLLAPVPLPLAGGLFVLKGHHFQEERELGGRDATTPPESLRRPRVLGLGARYLPHAKEGAPRFFLEGERYGDPRLGKERPMTELVLGAELADEDMPWNLKLDPTDEAESKIAVRYRRFPGFTRWLVYLGHKIERKSGFRLDVELPTHALFGWAFADDDWVVYVGLKHGDREYPVAFEDGEPAGSDAWVDGDTTRILGGGRRRIVGPLYVAAELGLAQERWSLIDDEGTVLERHATRPAPFARAAIETWFTTP